MKIFLRTFFYINKDYFTFFTFFLGLRGWHEDRFCQQENRETFEIINF